MQLVQDIGQLWREFERHYRLQSVRGMRRDMHQLDDFFMLITLSEVYGIDNPFAYYMLEMLPELMPHFHDWHQRMGVDVSFFENFPCSCCC